MTEAPPISAITQKSILFVDDDPEFVQAIERLLRLWSNNRLEILSAYSANAALAMLQQRQPDVIVLDVCMPVVDGVQLLSMLNRRYPDIPKVVLTSNLDDEYRRVCLDNGAELFLEKPHNSEAFEVVFATLEELTRWKPEAGFRGVLRSVGLTDVIQMECIARSSSVLSVASKELSGAIYIRDGSIIHAEAGESKGETAFKHLIALVSGDFKSLPFSEPPEQTIEVPWESLLMDAAQARDEYLGAEAERAELSTPLSLPESDPVPFPRSEERCPPIEVDELMICSEAGDVYHSWQCENTELRINLLEFLTQKARALRGALPMGEFDRTEFISSGSRLVARTGPDHGIVVRSSLAGIAAPKNDTILFARTPSRPQTREKALQWFEARLEMPGLFAATLQFPDRTGPSHSRSPKFTSEALELIRRSAIDGFQVLKLQRFPAQRTRWHFEQIVIECAQWPDGSCLALVFNRRAFDLNASLVEQHIHAFLALEQS